MGGTRKNDLLITEYRIPMGEGKVKVGGFQSGSYRTKWDILKFE